MRNYGEDWWNAYFKTWLKITAVRLLGAIIISIIFLCILLILWNNFWATFSHPGSLAFPTLPHK